MMMKKIRELALRLVDTELEGNLTTMNYRREVKRNICLFFSWLWTQGIHDIKTIGKAALLAYCRFTCHQKTRTGTRTPGQLISRRTINGRITAVKKVFAALFRAGYIKEDPFYGLDLGAPPDRKFTRLPFTEKEMKKLLERIDPSTSIGLRDRTLFELIYSSGLRVGEAARLAMGDCDLLRREIIVHGKGSRDRLVPISPLARDFLKRHTGDRINRLEEPVFLGTRGNGLGKPMRPEGISRRFSTLLKEFDMDGIGRSTHAIRHSTATHLLDRGASIRHVQELLGHKNINTTVRYTLVQTPGLQKIYRKYHPGERELFETVDKAYLTRLENLVAARKKA